MVQLVQKKQLYLFGIFLKKRIKIHNAGKGAKFTKGRKWKVIYYEIFGSKKKAMRREYYIKKDRKLRKKIKENFNL